LLHTVVERQYRLTRNYLLARCHMYRNDLTAGFCA
jgi:hypothetical protein